MFRSEVVMWSLLVLHAAIKYLSNFLNICHCFTGCISADESSNRLFLSDSNHHRIIILNGNGKILDCVCMKTFKWVHVKMQFSFGSFIYWWFYCLVFCNKIKWISQITHICPCTHTVTLALSQDRTLTRMHAQTNFTRIT